MLCFRLRIPIPSGRQTDPSDYTIRVSHCQHLFSTVRLILSHPNFVVNHFLPFAKIFPSDPSAPSERSTFWVLCQVKSSSSKKIFLSSLFCDVSVKIFSKIFRNFRSYRTGAVLSSIFLRSSKKKKKKNIFSYFITHLWGFCPSLFYYIFFATAAFYMTKAPKCATIRRSRRNLQT